MIRAISFDMDDTLIDTSGLLVPHAARGACRAMADAGLKASFEKCLEWRAELAPNHSHRDIFRLIAERAGAADPQALGDIGAHVFYNPPLPEKLDLLPGADDVLRALGTRLTLFLVTSGVRETQWKKIRAAGLDGRFTEIFVVEKFQNESKETAFRKILNGWNLKPAELLSVGNRLREEIRHAKKLGAQTCYFEYGEHLGETPAQPEDVPDFRVGAWKDFLAACRL